MAFIRTTDRVSDVVIVLANPTEKPVKDGAGAAGAERLSRKEGSVAMDDPHGGHPKARGISTRRWSWCQCLRFLDIRFSRSGLLVG